MACRQRRPPAASLLVLVMVPVLALVLGIGWTPAAFAAFISRTANAASSFTSAGTFPTYPQAVLADGPVAYYRLDDAAGATSVADSSGGGNTGTYVSPLATFQVPGSPAGGSAPGDPAVRLNAGESGALSADTALSSPDTYTTEVWFSTVATSGQRLLEFSNATSGPSSTTDRFISMTAAGKVSLVVGSTTVTSAASFNNGAWHLVTASLGAAGMKLYVDGSSVATNAGVTAGTSMPTGYWRLGGDVTTYFTGSLDEAAVFTTQLSDARVAAHYTAGAGAGTLAAYASVVNADGPWAFWHLNDPPLTVYQGGAFATPMADAGGQGHPGTYRFVRPLGMVAGGSGALVASQAASTSVRFRGAGYGVDPTVYTNPAAWSEELWFRSAGTTGGLLFQFGVGAANAYPGTFDRTAYLTNAGKIVYGVYNNGIQTVTSPASYTDGAWHHVVGTGGPGGLALYVDGALVAANTAITAGENTSGRFRWGGGNTQWGSRPSSDYLAGDIDEVAFYLNQLSAQQVAWHYHANH